MQTTMAYQENIVVVYIRALEHLAERIDSIRSQEADLNHFIKQDLIFYEYEISKMIQELRAGGYPSNNELLYAALELYSKDLQEIGKTVKNKLDIDTIGFPLLQREIGFIEQGLKKARYDQTQV